MKTKFTTQQLVFAGLLVAMEIILTRFVQIPIPSFSVTKDRISLGFLPIAIGGMFYGPIGGGIIAGVSDVLRAIILAQNGAINPLYTITAALRGVLYGSFLKESPKWHRILLVSAIIFSVVNLILNSAITAFSYGGTFISLLIPKLAPATINFVIQLVILIPALPRLERSLKKNVRKQ